MLRGNVSVGAFFQRIQLPPVPGSRRVRSLLARPPPGPQADR